MSVKILITRFDADSMVFIMWCNSLQNFLTFFINFRADRSPLSPTQKQKIVKGIIAKKFVDVK